MYVLTALLWICIALLVITVLWGIGEWKHDPVEFFEPEKKIEYDVPIFTTKKPSVWDKLLDWFE